MEPGNILVIIRGGGDLATGVAYRLNKAGFPIVVLELAQPLVVRRRVALATAVLEGEISVEGLTGRLVGSFAEALKLAPTGVVPVVVSPELPARQAAPLYSLRVVVDARMAKRNVDTTPADADLVIALGPGFRTGVDCHAVVETKRGHRLGRVIWQGPALPDTGTPGVVGGKGAERVLRAPAAGPVNWQVEIGDTTTAGAPLGQVGGESLVAPFTGVIRGLIAPGTVVWAGLKIGDLDPRLDREACFTISDKALALGGGVVEALGTFLASRRGEAEAHEPFDSGGRAAQPPLSLPGALGLGAAKELVAFVGGGGKTSAMFALARQLSGRIVLTTTTRIFAAQIALAPSALFVKGNVTADQATAASPLNLPAYSPPALGRELKRFGACLVVGETQGDKALGVPVSLPGEWLARPDVDYVLLEADGSRMRPCKAPADHEPAIPAETTLVVPVVGVDAVGGRLDEVCHRPALAGPITGLAPADSVTPEALAVLLTSPAAGLKGVPPTARVVALVNKVEDDHQLAVARQIARSTLGEERIEAVIIGAAGSARPVVEVHRRVTAVVLAAGRGSRMGQTKQLLPWGATTVLGQTLANVRQSAVHDVLVVSGHEATAVARVAQSLAVPVIHNPDYDRGEMLSSVQLAVGGLEATRAAVLVVLADQPMIEPGTMDRILAAYWQGYGSLIAPVYHGRRGNPVLIGRPYFEELLALPPGAAPRDLLRRHEADLYLVEVLTDTVLRDMDRVEEYERWRPPSF
jgi:probable selenium-dependent hydroxylase accessory protein YqeC